MKKIHVITQYFYPVIAGIELNIFETYRRLAEDGWDVTIHTFKDTYLKKDHLPEFEQMNGLKIHRYTSHWYGFIPKINWTESMVLALHNFDIFPHMLLLLKSLYLKATGQKKFVVVVTPHGGYNPEWSIYTKIQEIIKKSYTYTVGTFLINSVADAVRAVSEWEKVEMIKKGLNPQKVSVIANGLEDEAFSNSDDKVTKKTQDLVKSWGKYLFEDARIYSIKNQETVIKALPLIPAGIKFVNIGMTGDQKYQDSLISLAKRLNVSDRVIFPGVIKGEDKYYINRHALAFVHMAKWESFCNVVHQAISQGLVCIVANNTALPYLVKDKINGFLVDTFDHIKLAEKINYVLDSKNEKEIRLIKSYNLKHGRSNSWANVAKKMNDLYLKLYHGA